MRESGRGNSPAFLFSRVESSATVKVWLPSGKGSIAGAASAPGANEMGGAVGYFVSAVDATLPAVFRPLLLISVDSTVL